MSLTPYSQKLSAEDAAHLLRRASFGATDLEIQALVGQHSREAVETLLNFGQERAAGNPFNPMEAATPRAGKQLTRSAWLFEMLYGPFPVREKLTLMWSNHFIIGTDKVRNMPMLASYLDLLRSHATTTNFTKFVLDIARAPAMLRYLDNYQNRKGKPNENFSRELLELFTVGIGTPTGPNYTEQDVLEGARALTGWTFTGGRGNQNFLEESRFEFKANQHDTGQKTYLGHTGHFGGEDIVRLAAAHPSTATFIARKLHRTFVRDVPDEQDVAESAKTFHSKNGNIRATLAELLSSQVFYAPQNRSAIIRSPIEFIVGAIRTLGQPKLQPKQILNMVQAAGQMGQVLLEPDTVKGWDGGREWINDSILLRRMQLAAALTLSKDAPELREEPTSLSLLGLEKHPFSSILTGLNQKQRLYLILISPEFSLV